jgi:hypothetical protein
MRIYDILTESEGLKAATKGEIYTDKDGLEWEFQSWKQFPLNQPQFNTPEELDAAIAKIEKSAGVEILWAKEVARPKALGIATFLDPNSQQLKLFGGTYQQVSPNNTITDGQVTQAGGLRAGSKDKPTSNSIKTSAQLKPQQVGITDERARTINSIISLVANHPQGPVLVDGLKSAVNGKPIIFKDSSNISLALQDDFGEIIGPIAMISGNPIVTGTLDAAVNDIFGGNIQGATISFPVSLSNSLVDSYINKGGKQLAVSSKGKKGANGSLNNIYKAKEEALQNPNGQTVVKEFPTAIEILDINKNESFYAALTLGLKFKLINGAEDQAIRTLLKDNRSPSQLLIGNPKNPKAIVKPPTSKDLAKVPQVLHRIFTMGGYRSGSYVGWICLARVAFLVAQYVNSDAKINFGEAIRQLLNSSAMVQVKTRVESQNADAIVKNINVVYPPNFQNKAKMESNWFSGKGTKGAFSFSLPTS